MEVDRRKFLKIIGFGTLGIIGIGVLNKIPRNALVNAQEISQAEAVSVIEKLSTDSPRKYAEIKRVNPIKNLYIPKYGKLEAPVFLAATDYASSANIEIIEINIRELEEKIYKLYYQALENNKHPWGVVLCPEHEIAISYCFDKMFSIYHDCLGQKTKLMGLDVLRSEVLDISQSPLIV